MPARRHSGWNCAPATAASGALHLRLYRRGEPVAMSDILPLLENFDLRILNERPYRVAPTDGSTLWIQDIEVKHAAGRTLDPELEGRRFEQAFFAVHHGQAESDGFNRLVLAAGLDWKQALILRAVCRYLLQTGIPFSQRYMEAVLARNPSIAARLAWTFESRFDPDLKPATRASQVASICRGHRRRARKSHEPRRRPHPALVPRGDHGHVAHKLLSARRGRPAQAVPLVQARPEAAARTAEAAPDVRDLGVLATRRRRAPAHGQGRARRPALVRPARGLPHRDSRSHEGAERQEHADRAGRRQGRLRAEADARRRLARGSAARGHRVLPPLHPRPARHHRQRASARRIIPPDRTVRYDPDDPYLVVAADKGTATFSDTANALAAEYGFWLGDAFASGGSAGYDHKKMGITAQGRVGMRQAALPRTRPGHAVAGLHGRRHRRHGGRRVRQRHAALAAHPAGGRLQPPAHLPRPGARRGPQLQGARAPLQPAPLVVDRLRREADFQGRWRVPAQCQGDCAIAAGPRAARHRCAEIDTRWRSSAPS